MMAILPKLMYRFNAVLACLFYSNWQTDPKIYKKFKAPRIAKISCKKKNKVGGLSLCDFKMYYKATVMKTVRSWHKDREKNQWNRIENPIRNSHISCQLIFAKGDKTIQWRKDSLFNEWCLDNWITPCQRIKLDLYLDPYTKTNSK